MNKWSTIEKREKCRGKIFRYSCVERKSQDSGKGGTFDVISSADWVCIVALDKNKDFLLVRQYRQGRDEITLEFPGGGKGKKEDALLAAKRELREETGHVSKSWRLLGKVLPNPALMDNACYIYLAQDCEEMALLDLDPLEEIEVVKMSLPDLELGIREGTVNHCLVLSGLALFYFHQSSMVAGDKRAMV